MDIVYVCCNANCLNWQRKRPVIDWKDFEKKKDHSYVDEVRLIFENFNQIDEDALL